MSKTIKTAQLARPFGIRDQTGYLCGNLANDLTYTLASGYLMKFYTDVLSVDAYVVGIVMMVAQVVDAFTDVAMGQIVDRSEPGPNGKFRPWIRRIAGPITVCSFLMYAVWLQNAAMPIKIAWLFVSYILYTSVFYTAELIPYGSLASAISDDPVDRTLLSNWRHIGGTLSLTFINVVAPLVIYYKNAEGNEIFSGTRMAILAGVFSVIAFVFYLLCYHLTTERVKLPRTTEKFSLKEFALDFIHNKSLIVIIAMILLQECSNSAFHGMSGYIFPNYFGSAAAQSLSGVLETVITLVIAAFIVFVVARTGKKEITVFGSLFAGIVFAVAFVLHTHSVVIWLVIYCLVTVGMSLYNPVAYALVTDVIDDEEVRTGKRSDGAIQGIYSFSRKCGSAVSSGIRGVMLSAVGYTAATAYDTEVLNGIYNVSCLVPMCGFLIMALVVGIFYPLNKKKVEQNVAILKERREGKASE